MHQLIFSIIIVMFGFNSITVNADTANYLLDIDGNPIEYNKSYYMEPCLFNGRGIAYETWLGEDFVLLQHESGQSPSGQTIRFDHYAGIGGNKYVQTRDWTIIRADSPPVDGLDMFGYNPTYHGVQLGTVARAPKLPKDTQVWIPDSYSENINVSKKNNYITFRNLYNNKYLSYKNTNDKSWLDARKDNIQEETLWRLIEK
ncbi:MULTISPECIES: hypothetical protein [Bacillus cereus group]|uniref:Uncharacterized protein n=1 Tax=Bacillus thuringiensis TaxID=1428 RepID=A0A9X7AQ93_BACTU|nr:hypothetical protein [Bacillus thuringiensis]MCQ6337095.1 hypothetical protein [Bacillus cereus]PFT48671.1 hypothetical protein COK72_07990 [Bacillus thuringiensis]